jgi:hypothetical protein
MSGIVERLRMQNEVRLSLGNDFSDLLLDAADRIEQLEERMRGADALIVLWETRATRAEARVKQLEAALRHIAREGDHVSRAAICNTAEQALRSSPPARQENDDVFKGFRGNNEA